IAEALDAILKPNGFAYRKEGNFTYVYTQEEMARIEEDERVPVTRTFRLNYISPADAKAFISSLLSPNEGKITIGPVASGGLSSGSSTTTGMRSLAIEDIIMVHDYEDRLREIEKTLAELDKRPKQVLVEATILRVSLTESNALGIDFNVLGGVDFKMLAAADGRTGLIPNSANSSSNLGQNQTGTGGSLTGGLSLGSNARNLGTLNNQVPISKLNDLSIGIGTQFAANVPTGGISFGLVTDQVSMFIRALESVSDVVVIGNPKVLALNKQEAHVLVGSRDGFLTTQITTQTATTQSIDYLETGTQLRFTPFISNDGFARMRVTPSDSTSGEAAAPEEPKPKRAPRRRPRSADARGLRGLPGRRRPERRLRGRGRGRRGRRR
ncbi:MAG: hypothetical protein IIC25_03200, partial [Chloroflexi bacterium]|nr:hypothetical protein [Chloroflexota bacterium]